MEVNSTSTCVMKGEIFYFLFIHVTPSMNTSTSSRFLNKRLLITGGTSGIGKALAYAFAKEGAKIVITGRRQEKGEKIAKDIQGYYISIDHNILEDNQKVIETAVTYLGGLDILINNAGIVLAGNIETTSLKHWLEIFNVNVHTTYILSQAAIPYLRKSYQDHHSTIASTAPSRDHSIIINVASDWGIVGARNYTAYCTTKAAVVQLTKCLALDYIQEGMRVNCICPGDTYVERWSEEGYYRGSTEKVTFNQANIDAKLDSEMNNGIPIGRVADTEEIVSGILFLASKESSYMVGQSLIIDGGNTCK